MSSPCSLTQPVAPEAMRPVVVVEDQLGARKTAQALSHGGVGEGLTFKLTTWSAPGGVDIDQGRALGRRSLGQRLRQRLPFQRRRPLAQCRKHEPEQKDCYIKT